MNYKLSITFPNPSELEIPNFERVFTRSSIHEIVRDANVFLRISQTRLLCYSQNVTIGSDHVSEAIDREGWFKIAICSKTNGGPLQIMEFKKTDDTEIGENLIFKTPTKLETKTKYQDALALALVSVPSFNNADDINLLTKQIELAKKEFARNLRYAAIDKLQDIRERHSSTQNLTPDVETMFDEMIGALMNLKS